MSIKLTFVADDDVDEHIVDLRATKANMVQLTPVSSNKRLRVRGTDHREFQRHYHSILAQDETVDVEADEFASFVPPTTPAKVLRDAAAAATPVPVLSPPPKPSSTVRKRGIATSSFAQVTPKRSSKATPAVATPAAASTATSAIGSTVRKRRAAAAAAQTSASASAAKAATPATPTTPKAAAAPVVRTPTSGPSTPVPMPPPAKSPRGANKRPATPISALPSPSTAATTASTPASAATAADLSRLAEEPDEEQVAKRRRRTRKNIQSTQLIGPSDEYFMQHATRKTHSRNTLLEKGIPHGKELEDMWSSVTDTHAHEKQQLLKSYRTLFNKWYFQLSNGFNLLFYGVGSKQQLLNEFAEAVCNTLDVPLVSIRGFEPLTYTRVHDILEKHSGKPRVLLVHSIDGESLRPPRCAGAVVQAASSPGTLVIASMDHFNTPLLWDGARATVLKWLFVHTTTFVPYVQEARGLSLASTSGAGGSTERTVNILESIPPNGRNCFIILARTGKEGLSFAEWYDKCYNNMLVTSEIHLQTHYKEFYDHKLVKEKRRRFTVQLNQQTIKQLIDRFGCQQNELS